MFSDFSSTSWLHWVAIMVERSNGFSDCHISFGYFRFLHVTNSDWDVRLWSLCTSLWVKMQPQNQHIWCQQILRAPHCQTRCLFSIVFKYVQDAGLVSDTKTLQNCTPQIWTSIDVDFPGLASHCGQSESEFILQDLAVCGPVSQTWHWVVLK